MRGPQGRADAFRAVVFDLDDTLVPVQTVQRWQWAWKPNGPVLSERHARAAIRRELHAWDRRRWRGLVGSEPAADPEDYREHLNATLLAIADRKLPPDEVEAVVDRFLKPVGPIETYPDALPAARALATRSIPFAVVTPMPEPSARGFLRRAALDEDCLAPLTPGAPSLPDRAGFRAAVARLGVRPEEAVFVGDLFWSDVRAAARGGLATVLLDRDDLIPGARGPRIRSLSELDAVIAAGPDAPAGPARGPSGPGASPPGSSEGS